MCAKQQKEKNKVNVCGDVYLIISNPSIFAIQRAESLQFFNKINNFHLSHAFSFSEHPFLQSVYYFHLV